MKVLWLKLAEEDLDAIYQFYVDNKSLKFANKIYNEILDAADLLTNFPYMAPIEQDLSDDDDIYRSLIVRKYFKIIYYVEDYSIYILAVWDCRQSPQTNINKISD